MPTEQARRERQREIRQNRTIIAERSALIVLVFLGFGRLYEMQRDTTRIQNEACQLRSAGRADGNEHERIPLKAALNYLATLGDQGADKATSAEQRAALQMFAARLRVYADAVRPLPNPEC